MMKHVQTYLSGRLKSPSSKPDSGFTIIESLMAIVVLTVLLIAIAPPMAISVASRVRARQVELATQAGQGYIDSLRSGAISPPDKARCATDILPNSGDPCLAPPAAALLTAPDEGTLINANGNASSTDPQDFVIQAIRTRTSADTNADPVARGEAARREGYGLLIRVYRGDADVFTGGAGTPSTTPVANLFTGATAKGGGFRNRPLIVLKTDIGTRSTSSNIQQRIPNLFN
ncbi:prepilin-type N-terminal cleavage/methylation domain-containing protein [Trichocoleus sp. FACHB-591]|uniref:prepilin-type N-terminal cleavage/methylation domain-containing protein n=1 Tax=Trichocoleus sp. FACHB-591 TaxID=2692872 RepID=UPI0018EFFCAB|nr:prepilin-type N-terminal cleavage/methylation domain-containing protein [Trichocoleus sp. FACHB-591]